MQISEYQDAIIRQYLSIDAARVMAKGGNVFSRHPLDEESNKAYAELVAAFRNQMEANDALYATIRPQARVTRRAAREDTPRAPRATRSAAVRDPRIPPAGTAIFKLDRHGALLAQATVLEDGIEYDGVRYGSPSAAGLAASKALGLGTKAVDGYTFWGLNKKG